MGSERVDGRIDTHASSCRSESLTRVEVAREKMAEYDRGDAWNAMEPMGMEGSPSYNTRVAKRCKHSIASFVVGPDRHAHCGDRAKPRWPRYLEGATKQRDRCMLRKHVARDPTPMPPIPHPCRTPSLHAVHVRSLATQQTTCVSMARPPTIPPHRPLRREETLARLAFHIKSNRCRPIDGCRSMRRWTRIKRYFAHDFKEIVWPSPMEDPPGTAAEVRRKLTLRENLECLRDGTKDYLEGWKVSLGMDKKTGDEANHVENRKDQSKEEWHEDLEVAAKLGAIRTAEGIKPILQRLYFTRLSAYKEAVQNFVEGYREGLREELQPKKDGKPD